MIQFNYKGEKYIINFLPCGFLLEVAKVKDHAVHYRSIKYDRKLKVKTFLEKLEKLDFYF